MVGKEPTSLGLCLKYIPEFKLLVKFIKEGDSLTGWGLKSMVKLTNLREFLPKKNRHVIYSPQETKDCYRWG